MIQYNLEPEIFSFRVLNLFDEAARRNKMLLENAQLDLKRYKTLLSQDSVSSQVYDTQKAPAFSFTPLERAEIMKKEVEEEQRRKDIEMIELTQATDDGITVVGSSKKGAQSDNKEGFKAMGKVDDFKEALAPVGSSCSSYSSFMNSSLDILDIGCGTGLAGTRAKYKG